MNVLFYTVVLDSFFFMVVVDPKAVPGSKVGKHPQWEWET